jgi:hypothetical protein
MLHCDEVALPLPYGIRKFDKRKMVLYIVGRDVLDAPSRLVV